jgi:hypothetical protein
MKRCRPRVDERGHYMPFTKGYAGTGITRCPSQRVSGDLRFKHA